MVWVACVHLAPHPDWGTRYSPVPKKEVWGGAEWRSAAAIHLIDPVKDLEVQTEEQSHDGSPVLAAF